MFNNLKTWQKVALAVLVPSVVVGGYIFVKKVILKQPLFPIFPKKDGEVALEDKKNAEAELANAKTPEQKQEAQAKIETAAETKKLVDAGKSITDFPLNVGSKGEKVKYLQNALNKLGASPQLKSDGDFGKKTYTAVVTNAGTKFWTAKGVTQAGFTEILKLAAEKK